MSATEFDSAQVARPSHYCIVGAGTSGLAVAKNFLQSGIGFDCYEREDDVGGNWYFGRPHSSVYRSTHLISSKPLTEYTDFPMPREYPDYPNHQQVFDYIRSYARHFGLYEHIQFNTAIERIEPVASGDGWRVKLFDGSERVYQGVVISNGHNWDPKFPDFPGNFDGPVLHSAQYKTPDVLRDKRVLVVGAGNSGCDIAVESAQNAARTLHSVRRGYHYLPKYVNGKPADQVGERLLRWRLPLWLRRWIARKVVKFTLGSPCSFGLPSPNHKLFETHPIINSQLLYYVGHGDIHIKGDVQELCGRSVRFVDGSEEEVDLIIYATGFKISFPFIDREHLNWGDGRPQLYLNVFHPLRDDLFFCGLIQPDSGQWGLVDYQAQLIARYITALARRPDRARWFGQQKAGPPPQLNHGIHYVHSARHLLEVEHFSYRRRLQKMIARLS